MRIRARTYNIKNGALVGHNMEKIGEDIRACRLDLVGIQEVDRHTDRTDDKDTLIPLWQASGLAYRRFTRSISYGGGVYGTAILSRFPILDFFRVPLPTLPLMEQRSVGIAKINAGGFVFTFANTHLSLGTAGNRKNELACMAARLEAPYLLTGDFNTEDDREFAVFSKAKLTNREGARLPSFYGTGEGIDNILYTPPFRLCEADLYRVPHSDHYMLYAEYEWE